MQITQLDPELLKQGKFSDCKPKIKQLFAIGNLELLKTNILGIVWPRSMSSYANQILESFFEKSKGRVFTTISGLAKGVDQKCHSLSLRTNLPTIAVLGGGIEYYLKTSNHNFMMEIIEKGGLILSEFDVNFKPTSRSFPLRNRIIASLSDMLFLPEAREGSGSLITVNYALKIKRPVFIAPNPLFSLNGEGSNQLLASGKWQLLSNFSQILDQFKNNTANEQEDNMYKILNSLTIEEQQIYSLVKQHSNQELSTRIWASELDTWEIMTHLTLLEMKGIIRQSWPGMYITS